MHVYIHVQTMISAHITTRRPIILRALTSTINTMEESTKACLQFWRNQQAACPAECNAFLFKMLSVMKRQWLWMTTSALILFNTVFIVSVNVIVLLHGVLRSSCRSAVWMFVQYVQVVHWPASRSIHPVHKVLAALYLAHIKQALPELGVPARILQRSLSPGHWSILLTVKQSAAPCTC